MNFMVMAEEAKEAQKAQEAQEAIIPFARRKTNFYPPPPLGG